MSPGSGLVFDMAIYNISGTDLNDTAYRLSGSALNQAFDIEGNELFNSGTPFVVMTYNVQRFSGLNSNQSLQEEILGVYDADIIGLQEVTTGSSMPALGTALLSDEYPYIYLGGQYNKSALVSKTALSNVSTSNFTNQASETKGYQKAYLTIDGKTVCWINTHLETSDHESVKVAQAGEIFALVQNEDYFIITGDFNTVCKFTSDTEYTTIMKQFVAAGYQIANCSEQHGFIDTWTSGHSSEGTWYPCDHIITSANISIDSVTVDQRKIAVAAETSQSIDHLPLIAELTIN